MDFRLFVGLCILACGSDFVKATCPSDPMTEVPKCTQAVGFDFHNPGTHELVTNITLAHEFCRSGKLNAAIECLENLAERCQDHANSIELNMMFQAKNLKKSAKLMCDNIDYLVEENKCLADGRDEMILCVRKEIKKFNADIKLKGLSSKTSGDDGTKMNKAAFKLACRYVDSVRECVTTHARKHCPKKYANILKDILMGVIPPVCEKEKKNGTGKGSEADDGYQHVGDGNDNGSARILAPVILQVFVSVSLGVWKYFL